MLNYFSSMFPKPVVCLGGHFRTQNTLPCVKVETRRCTTWLVQGISYSFYICFLHTYLNVLFLILSCKFEFFWLWVCAPMNLRVCQWYYNILVASAILGNLNPESWLSIMGFYPFLFLAPYWVLRPNESARLQVKCPFHILLCSFVLLEWCITDDGPPF